jgi:hypothetical protein
MRNLIYGAIFATSALPVLAQSGLSMQSFGFGPAAIKGADQMAYQFAFGRQWEVDPQAAIKARGSWAVDFESGQNLGLVGIGANYYLSQNNVAPFVGAQFGFGTDGKDAAGFGVEVSGGLSLFRGKVASLMIEPNFQILLNKSKPLSGGVLLSVAFGR